MHDIGARNIIHTYIQKHYVYKKSPTRDRAPACAAKSWFGSQVERLGKRLCSYADRAGLLSVQERM